MPLFPQLPFELRLIIWTEACFKLHIIELENRTSHHSRCLYPSLQPQHHLPGVLLACKESRQIALKHYTRCEENRPGNPYEYRSVFINLDADIFLHSNMSKGPRYKQLDTTIFDYNFGPKTLQKIQNLDLRLNVHSRCAVSGFKFLRGVELKTWNIVVENHNYEGRMECIEAQLMRLGEQEYFNWAVATYLSALGKPTLGFKWPQMQDWTQLEPSSSNPRLDRFFEHGRWVYSQPVALNGDEQNTTVVTTLAMGPYDMEPAAAFETDF